ncbi:MAG: aspartate kinase, partial [Gammaproteobacteria bacterium]
MTLIVQKFGGTSVGDIDRIRGVAALVGATHALGHEVVVVVSAMSGETDRLIALAKQLTPRPNARELDVLLATGEQVTIA